MRTDAHEVLVEHLRQAFIGDFGTTKFETWLGKDGLQQHTAVDFAEAAARALGPLLADPAVAQAVARLHADGVLAPPVPAVDPHDW